MHPTPHITLAFALVLVAPCGLAGQALGGSIEDGPPATFPIDPEAAPRPVLRASRATGPIVIDGVVDEAAWAGAQVATDFIQSKPNTGYPATERTEVRFLYDDDKLYIGAVMYDETPGLLVAQRLELKA